jgi:hypothetical protein
MAAVDRYIGDDIPLTLTSSISIDDMAELYVYLVHKSSDVVAKKFSKAGSGEFSALIKEDAYNYRADWLSGDTKEATIGVYNIDINVVETDADYQDSEKNTIGVKEAIDLKQSRSKLSSSE